MTTAAVRMKGQAVLVPAGRAPSTAYSILSLVLTIRFLNVRRLS